MATDAYSIDELAGHWGVNSETVARMIRAGTIKAFRVGRVWRITRTEVERHEQQLQKEPDKG